MTPARTSIYLKWDASGSITHRIEGVVLPPPRDDQVLWVLAPSATLLMAHQFGVMKPSHGLITCSRVVDMLFRMKYILMPINSALRRARIDFLYKGGSAIRMKFHPRYRFLSSSDSIEEGIRHLINNYMYYVYSQLPEYNRIVIRSTVIAAIGLYFEFLEEQVQRNTIGIGKDKWYPYFSMMSAKLIDGLSQFYYVPEAGRTPENEEWAKKQTDFLSEKQIQIESKMNSLFVSMGLY